VLARPRDGNRSLEQLLSGLHATSADQHLLFDTKSGSLIYDPDGSGAAPGIVIALLSGHTMVHASDITIVG
jgi:hypothetical protein